MNQHDENIEIMKDLRNRLDAVLKDNPSDIGKALTEPLGIPDPTKHKYISFAKSGVRIVGALVLISGNFVMAGVCLALAEVLGIVEEMV